MFILKLCNLTVSVVENSLFSEVTIFPNPTEGLVNINLDKLKDVSIKVMDISGQLVYHQTHINTSVHQFKLNVTTGLYFLEIVDAAGEKSIRKIIIN
ncbi:MAG: T9SS type A sorting domain-containing protein [Flavobacteriales bacterium]|nr:T9SS type A sorting domain-containing protein [Flavobacteriales bacterium]